MGIKMILVLLTITFIGMSCSEVEDDLSSNLLEGVWVNSVTKTDTLDFSVKPSFTNAKNVFQLKRGTEVNRGYEMPKIGNGYYEYFIDGEKITLKGLIIDIHAGKEYLFKQNIGDNAFQIGSFAPFDGNQSVYEFVRVK